MACPQSEDTIWHGLTKVTTLPGFVHYQATETMSAAFTYQTADTAQIDEVSPARGGTKGGTVITITGSNFGLVCN